MEWPLADLQRVARSLLRTPVFTATVVLTLAIAAGAISSAFGVLQAVVLDPLPYAQPDQLVRLYSQVPRSSGGTRWGVARPEFLFIERSSHTLAREGLYTLVAGTVSMPSGQQETAAAQFSGIAMATSSLLDVFGTPVLFGRPFAPSDNLVRSPSVTLLSYQFWKTQFGGDSGVVGRTIAVNDASVQVIGVLPPSAKLPEELQAPDLVKVDLWMPLFLDPSEPSTPGGHILRAIARMRPETRLNAVRADLSDLTARLPDALPSVYPSAFLQQTGFTMAAAPLRTDIVEDVASTLWIVFGTLILVLLIAVANVSNLFVARLEARRRDAAIRTALGASRSRLIRAAITESLLVSMAATVLALVFASVAFGVLRENLPFVPRLSGARIEAGTVVFTIGVGLCVSMFVTVLAIGAVGGDSRILADSSHAHTASRIRHRVRGALVMAQLGVSLVLLAAAGLLLQTRRHLNDVPLGLDPAGVLSVRVVLPQNRYASFESVISFYQALESQLGRLPSVTAVGFASDIPLSGFDGCSRVIPIDASTEIDPAKLCVPVHLVSPGYFGSLGIPIRGSNIPASPGLAKGLGDCVVSEAFANRFWQGKDAVGKSIRLGGAEGVASIIGVVRNVHAGGPRAPATEDVYCSFLPDVALPLTGGPPTSVVFVLRADRARPLDVLPSVRRALGDLDPRVPIISARPMSEMISDVMRPVVLSTNLVWAASAIALLLSLIGTYGLVSYVVALRQREFGIRIALGAKGLALVKVIAQQVGILAAGGVLLGLGGALGLTRVLSALLFGIKPADPLVMAGASILLIVATAGAAWLPAWKAIRTDPISVLRLD